MYRFKRANTILFWYNVNASGTGNRTYTLNVGDPNISLNRLDGMDGLAEQDRWQHVAAVMSGQKRSLYFNGSLVAESIGSDNLVTMEGSGVRIGSRNQNGNFDFEGELDEVRLYNRSFLQDDIAVLYGNGNGDLGLTPIVTTDSQNSASAIHGRVEFHRFGEPIQVSDFDSSYRFRVVT